MGLRRSIPLPPARRLLALLVLALALAACRSDAPRRFRVNDVEPGGPRILAVVAHPDDETAFAGTLYKAATHAGATCDLVVVTNGEGGFKYATLAERLYGLELTREDVGRAWLPEVRRREMLSGATILGVRDVVFLGERDHAYTTDLAEVLGDPANGRAGVWDVARVREVLGRLLDGGRYDLLLVLAPAAETHAHHQAASILAVEAAAALPEGRRPLVLCAATADEGEAPEPPATVGGVRLAEGAPFVFDRRQPLGYLGRLDYRVVVNWVIAEHKSQGTMQLFVNRGDREVFWPVADGPAAGRARAEALFRALAEPQFPEREYGESSARTAAERPAAR